MCGFNSRITGGIVSRVFQKQALEGLLDGPNPLRVFLPLILEIFHSPRRMKDNGCSIERPAIYQLEVFLKLQLGSVDICVEVLGLLEIHLRLIYLVLRLL